MRFVLKIRTLGRAPSHLMLLLGLTVLADPVFAQGVDCARLEQQISAASDGGGGRLATAARKQSVELARTAAYARQLGCDRQFSFFGGGPPPQCEALNARIGQMQANLGQLQAGASGGGRADLVARFNAYCRGGQQSAALQPPPRQRGFFESLFGGREEPRPVPQANIPLPDIGPDGAQEGEGDDFNAHGGSQAVCVRTCDGAFFPMNMSARHGQDSLNEMCTALCPNAQAAVYTRNPNSEIKTAVSLDGTPYMDLPNALKFQKSFDAACTCRPPDKTWAEALSGAESALGNQRKGDIMVTPEKSAELSRPKLDGKTRSSLLSTLPAATQSPVAQAAAVDAKPPIDAKGAQPVANSAEDQTGPDGLKRHVRKVGPQL